MSSWLQPIVRISTPMHPDSQPACMHKQQRQDSGAEVLSQGRGLAACQEAEREVQEQLVSQVDQGCARPHGQDLPHSAAGRRFRQQCLRHMYVLCSRAVDSSGSHSCLLQARPCSLLCCCPCQCCSLAVLPLCSRPEAFSSSSSDSVTVCLRDGAWQSETLKQGSGPALGAIASAHQLTRSVCAGICGTQAVQRCAGGADRPPAVPGTVS